MNRPTEIKMKVMGPGGCSYSKQSTKEDLEDYGGSDWNSKENNVESAQPFGSWDGDDMEDLMLIPPRHWTNKWGYALRVIFTGLLILTSFAILTTFLYDIFHPKAIPPSELPLYGKEPIGGSDYYPACSVPPGEGKFDCYPEVGGATKEQCLARGCCWKELEPNSNAPWCYFGHDTSNYDWGKEHETEYGYERKGTLKKSANKPYPAPIRHLRMSVILESEDTVRIKIFDPENVRWQVPYFNQDHIIPKPERLNYYVDFTDSLVNVRRGKGDTPLFSLSVSPLMFHDQFLEVTAALGAPNVYGIGETVDSMERKTNWSRSVLFNHDTVPAEKTNLYSSHPFLMAVSPYGGKSFGVFLANSNAMEVILQKYHRNVAATYRTIGGIFDFRIFVGPKPSDVMSQYTDIIGKPVLPPYWALGYHLCRFNYNTVNHTAEILENNLKAGIPVEVQWNDLDYMKGNNDFTYDPIKFKGLPEFVQSLHNRGMRYITLIDPGVSGGEPKGQYPPYDEGIAEDIFIKNSAGEVFVGKVWNGKSTVWPDFSHPNVTRYWLRQIENFRKQIPIDGAWIDMNDPSNFVDGELDIGCPTNSTLDHPPYVPHVQGGKLYYKTLCMSAKQYKGDHYDLHNLYGFQETIATQKVMGDLRSERSLVITRSSFPGTGAYGGSWTGDVTSTWDDMSKSIPQILSYGLFGIPMVGADICGFNGNTTKDLCKRWQQLGAFYPFMRNHNTDDGIPQDPASLGQEVIDAAKETLRVRYNLLPYIYTAFFNAHLTGSPVARPLFYEFPEDFNTYAIQNQFMLGPMLLVTPILVPEYSENEIQGYVPKGAWYSYYDGNEFGSSGRLMKLSVPSNSIPLLVRGGSIIVEQEPANTTRDSRKNPFRIKAFLCEKRHAHGEVYWDDGVTYGYEGGSFNHFNMSATNNDMTVKAVKYGYADTPMLLESVAVHGISGNVTQVNFNNVAWNFTFAVEKHILEVKTPGISLADGFQMNWVTMALRP